MSVKRIAAAVIMLAASVFCAHSQDSIVLKDSLVITVSGLSRMSICEDVSIMILNKEGLQDAAFLMSIPSDRTLKSFSGKISDLSGKVIRKYGMKDLASTEYSEGLADDYTTKYLDFKYGSFPYVVTWTCEVTCSDGFLTPPVFAPLRSSGQRLSRASYTLVAPREYGYSWKCLNCDITPTVTEDKGIVSSKWVISGLEPVSNGDLMPKGEDFVPVICFSPDSFLWFRREGSMKTVDDYGRWKWNLIEESSQIPAELAAKVHEMTDNLAGRREKVHALYDYMQKNYRYVSIQLGIGGQKPMAPEQVYRNKFGDCKALSNLMKTMLREIGIESCYVEISTERRSQIRDFAYPGFLNHAILKVPDPEGDMWIECTSSTLPMGYIHKGLAGHDAFVYQDGTMHIETVPDYSESRNLSTSTTEVRILDGSSAIISVEDRSTGLPFEGMFPFKSIDQDQRKDYLRSNIGFPAAAFSDISCNVEDNGVNSVMSVSYRAEIPKYTSKSGSRALIPLYPFRNQLSIDAPEGSRREPFRVYHGNTRIDDVLILIPDNMSVENYPESMSIENAFGRHSMKTERDEDGNLRIHVETVIHEGILPVKDYGLIKDIIRSIDRTAKMKISLIQR